MAYKMTKKDQLKSIRFQMEVILNYSKERVQKELKKLNGMTVAQIENSLSDYQIVKPKRMVFTKI